MGFSAKTVLLVAVLLSLHAVRAEAQDDGVVLSNEPTRYTDVIDAADDHDPFDLNLSIGFARSITSGTIQREISGPGIEPGQAAYTNVAQHRRLSNVLLLGMEVGVYRDVMVYANLPLMLSDERSLRAPNAGGMAGAAAPPFSVPFNSPTRSGIDYLALGAAWSITNQARMPSYRIWVLMLEGGCGVGVPLHACSTEAVPGSSAACRGEYDSAGNQQWVSDPGISSGTNALRVETRVSRRIGYIEPYLGFAFQHEFLASSDKYFSPGGALPGVVHRRPPVLGELTAGLAVVPWEHRGRHQRFTFDLRGQFAYVSAGRDYSPLFDALGISQDSTLTSPNLEIDCSMSSDPAACASASSVRRAYNYGLTDTQAHARLGARASLDMQAARYVRFTLGVSLYYNTPYLITGADPCNPGVAPDGADDQRIGTCTSGVINPSYRSSIDTPGRRFRLDGDFTVTFDAMLTAQF